SSHHSLLLSSFIGSLLVLEERTGLIRGYLEVSQSLIGGIRAQIRHTAPVAIEAIGLRQRMEADPTFEAFLFAQRDRRREERGADATKPNRLTQVRPVPRRDLQIINIDEWLACLACLACRFSEIHLRQALRNAGGDDAETAKGKQSLDSRSLLPPVPMPALRPLRDRHTTTI